MVLYPAAESFKLYPFPVGHPRDNFAQVDVAAPDLDSFPAFGHACGWEATLDPGDVLFVPRYTWHFVSQLSQPEAPSCAQQNVSLNFWFGRKGTGEFKRELWSAARRLPPAEAAQAAAEEAARVAEAVRAAGAHADAASANPEGLSDDTELEAMLTDAPSAVRALLAARHVEGCTSELLGGDATGPFLNSLAHGEDVGWDVASLAHRHATRTRLELIALLGSAAKANALLRAMTRDGRLHPGLTPPLGERVVNSERGQLSSLEDYNEALLATGVAPESVPVQTAMP